MNTPFNTDETSDLRGKLVEELKRIGCVRSPGIEEAFRAVPRHLFTPGVELERVYSDNSIPTKDINGRLVSSSSQPAMMAIMLEQLELQEGDRILEIGAGTGYNAGLMQYMVGDRGLVVTMDIDDDIVEHAREHLAAAGMDKVQVICGDGGLGYAEYAPYDRIILTVGAWDILPAWWDQLKPGGRLLLPLEISGGIQKSIAFDRVGDRLESRSVVDCGFMTLRGAFEKSQQPVSFGPEPGMSISVNEEIGVDGDTIYRLLSGPGEDLPSGVEVSAPEGFYGGLSLWLSLREPGLCSLQAEGESAEKGIVPPFLAVQSVRKYCVTIGLWGDEELCVFVRPPGQDSSEKPDDLKPFELFVRNYGAGNKAARRLIGHIRGWDAAGRPSSRGLQVKAYPVDSEYISSTDEFIVPKQWTRLVLGWQ